MAGLLQRVFWLDSDPSTQIVNKASCKASVIMKDKTIEIHLPPPSNDFLKFKDRGRIFTHE